MAQNLNNIAYGLNQPGVSVFPAPITANRAPTTSDKMLIGQTWINVPADDYYVLTSIDSNNAQWQLLAAGVGAIDQVTTSAGVVLPAASNINLVGGGATNIATSGAGNTATIAVIASPSFAGTTTSATGLIATTGNITAQAGSLVAALGVSAGTTVSAGTGISTATGNITAAVGNIVATAGSVSANTSVSAGTTVTAGTGITCSAFGVGVVQSDGVGVFSSSKGNDGQILIGSTAGAPAWASITPGTNIAIVNAANSITISAVTGALVLSYTSTAVTPYVVGATDDFISVDASGGIKTVQLPDAPATGRVFIVKDQQGVAAINNITVTTGGVVLIDGNATYVLNTNYEVGQFIFNGTSYEVY